MVLKQIGGAWTGAAVSRPTSRIVDKRMLRALRSRADAVYWVEDDADLDAAGAHRPAATGTQAAAPASNVVAPPPAIVAASQLRDRAGVKVKEAFGDAQARQPLKVQELKQVADEILQSIKQDPAAMLNVSRLKSTDEYTYLHCVAVCALLGAFAYQLRMSNSQCRSIGIGGLFHDLGKAKVPSEVLLKPGALTSEEFDLMKAHPGLGFRMLQDNGLDDPIALDICLHHHEKISGAGYPAGLGGADISVYARMAAICDVFDAVTSARCYKGIWDPSEALVRMASWKGHFDRRLLAQFIKMVGVYPNGSLVRLNSGLLAVVVEQRKDALYAPLVRAFHCVEDARDVPPALIDLSASGCEHRVLGREPRDAWDVALLEALSLP